MRLDGPFVPHTLMPSGGSSLPLLNFHIATRLWLLTSSGSKKKWVQIFLSLKVPGKGTPIPVPQRGNYGESCPIPEPSFTHLSDSSINKASCWQNLTFLYKSPVCAWRDLPSHTYGKRFTGGPYKKRADGLFKLSRHQLIMVVAILTGHAPVRTHVRTFLLWVKERN
jgi:hypothetical protein